MKVSVVPIGNSKGIRIPKAVLDECKIENEVIMEVEGDTILIRPLKRKRRKDWEKAFKRMRAQEDDQLLINDSIDLNVPDWEW